MYKATQRFADYISRSNRFVDRIIRGGNGIETSEVLCETDTDLLLNAYSALREHYDKAVERARVSKKQKALMNNETKGRPDSMLPKHAVAAKRRVMDAYLSDVGDVRRLEYHLDLISGRLTTLGAGANLIRR